MRGAGAVTLVGATKREINIYPIPQALETYAVTPEQVVSAVRNENQDLPVGAIRSLAQERVVQIDARMQRPEDFGRIIVARKGAASAGQPGPSAPIRLDQVARVNDGAQEVESLALYNGQRTLLLSVQKAQGDNTIEVVDGLNAAVVDIRKLLPPGVRLEVISDSSRPIRVAVTNVRQTLIEGAVLTVLIVFLFLNSWRSTVITGLTLPIALIGTFLFMNMFGFTINMITLMALSLCVGLLIDDAIVVRENIVGRFTEWNNALESFVGNTSEVLTYCYQVWWERIGATKASGITKLMFSEAQNFPEIAQFYQQEVILPGRALIRRILQRGMERGEFRQMDLEYGTYIVLAPMMFLMLWNNSMGPCSLPDEVFTPEQYIRTQIDNILHGLCVRPAAGATPPPSQNP